MENKENENKQRWGSISIGGNRMEIKEPDVVIIQSKDLWIKTHWDNIMDLINKDFDEVEKDE